MLANENANANAGSDSIIFNIKDTKLYSLLPLYQQKAIKHYQNFLGKDLKDRRIGVNIKQKLRIKISQMSMVIFSDQTLQELTYCLLWFIQRQMI